MNIRPPYRTVSSDECRMINGPDFRFEEKMDGIFATRLINGFEIVGEQMRDGSFYAFDCRVEKPLIERLDILDRMTDLLRPETGNDGSFFDDVISRGGEGIVIKNLRGHFGEELIKCKRVETFDFVVSEKHTGGKSTIRLHDGQNDCGWCACRSAFDSIQIGDIVEVSAFGFTASGKLREPRFVRVRPDKVHADCAKSLADIFRINPPAKMPTDTIL